MHLCTLFTLLRHSAPGSSPAQGPFPLFHEKQSCSPLEFPFPPFEEPPWSFPPPPPLSRCSSSRSAFALFFLASRLSQFACLFDGEACLSTSGVIASAPPLIDSVAMSSAGVNGAPFDPWTIHDTAGDYTWMFQ